MNRVKKIVSSLLVVSIVLSMSFSNLAKDLESGIFLVLNDSPTNVSEQVEQSTTTRDISETVIDEEIEASKDNESKESSIEESDSEKINEDSDSKEESLNEEASYEETSMDIEKTIEDATFEEPSINTYDLNAETKIDEETDDEIQWSPQYYYEESKEIIDINRYEKELFDEVEKKFNEDIDVKTIDNESNLEITNPIIQKILSDTNEYNKENDDIIIATASDIDYIDELDDESLGIVNDKVKTKATISDIHRVENVIANAGKHSSTASPSIIINSAYDRYEMYNGENDAGVKIYDNNGTYYDNATVVEVLRDIKDGSSNNPILLKLVSNIKLFEFDNSNDNYILLPYDFIENIVSTESGNGYINPAGISKLDHIEVDLTFNQTYLGKYDLFEYGVIYYLSCYEGILGEYYYYSPSDADIDKAALFYINNKIMDRTYNIVSEYFYKSPSGESLSFKPTWVVNSDLLKGSGKEKYVKQWINFPNFLIKTGEKYWNVRETIAQSTYLSEYSEGYYEQYLTEKPYGNVSERLVVLDDIYKSEEALLNDSMSNQTIHPYAKSNLIEIETNLREDTINDENKLRAGGVLPFDTYVVASIKVSDHRCKSIQVYLNGEKLVAGASKGLYPLTDGKCNLRIDSAKLYNEENARNIISVVLLDEAGDYLTDSQGRVLNNYISLIRNTSIEKEAYLVEFETNGGSRIPNISVEEGNILSLPSNPTKYQKKFLGWYEDAEYKEKFNQNEYITKSKKLYALWGDENKPKTYNGGGTTGGSGGSGGSGGGLTTLQNNGILTPANGMIVGSLQAIRGNFIDFGGAKLFIDSTGNIYANKWAYIQINDKEEPAWYKFDEKGNPVQGFYIENNKIYYFNTGEENINDAGKMVTGWTVIKDDKGDYYWYCFNEDDITESKGALLINKTTKDGFEVDQFGRWTVNGVPQKVDKKLTKKY